MLPWYNQDSDLFRVSKSKQALSDAGVKTGQALRSFGTATANKWTEIKWGNCFEILIKERLNECLGVWTCVRGFFFFSKSKMKISQLKKTLFNFFKITLDFFCHFTFIFYSKLNMMSFSRSSVSE